MTNNLDTNVIEIFSSVQGEGPYVGYRQIFVRFALCNLNCAYCDTKFEPQEYSKIESQPGSGMFNEIKNPITTNQLVKEIDRLNCFNHHSLSLTGGEPLLQVDFLNNFLLEIVKSPKNRNLKVYLETNGTLPQELEKVISNIDIISMDFKLESSTGKATPWEKHKEFIRVAQDRNKDIFVKVVVTSKITTAEIREMSSLVSSLDKKLSVILQPVTSNVKSLMPEPNFLLNVQEELLRKLTDVRIIPQVHKQLNLL